GQIRKLIVADGVIGRKNLAQNYDAAMFAGEKLRLKPVQINETLRRFTQPVRAPFFQILAGEFLKNETAENEIFRRFIEGIRRADIIFRFAMLERYFHFHRFPLTLDLKREHVSRVGVRADQIGKIDFAVKWIDIVPVLVDLVITDGHDNVANL